MYPGLIRHRAWRVQVPGRTRAPGLAGGVGMFDFGGGQKDCGSLWFLPAILVEGGSGMFGRKTVKRHHVPDWSSHEVIQRVSLNEGGGQTASTGPMPGTEHQGDVKGPARLMADPGPGGGAPWRGGGLSFWKTRGAKSIPRIYVGG